MSLNSVLRILEPLCTGYWGERVYAELSCLSELSVTVDGGHGQMILGSAKALLDMVRDQGSVTKDAVLACEQALAARFTEIKKLTIHAVGHAHIDMNWQWRYDETVNITLETFRTVLKLMDDFPEFTFSQSQASCYRIVEKYDPELLERIRQKVSEGRWEVVATAWTEADKNLSSGESLSRHILYTKRYMNKLFNLHEETLRLDFEPDTFGHSANVPEILNAGGIEYYYHCRGYEDGEIYTWRAPSGASVLVYRDALMYNKWVTHHYAATAPAFCARNGVIDMLMVYGVGDHGGGPTRRDLERIVDMSSWPLFPTIKFSSYHTFFDAIKPRKDTFPVVERELNFVFTGCYTAQTRIKAANRIAEAALFEAEALAALSPVGPTAPGLFEEAWRNVLFSQFHDILPGAGVADTREYARGLFHEVLAHANSQKGIVCYAIADIVDTSAISGGRSVDGMISEGAGVGFGIEREHSLATVERGSGLRRGYLLFNTAGERADVTTLTIWDWPGDRKTLRITDSTERALPFQILEDSAEFWAHHRTELAVECAIPAMGWKLVIVDEDINAPVSIQMQKIINLQALQAPRVHKPYEYVLENELLRAELNPVSGAVHKLTDKRTGKTVATGGGFYGFTESPNVSNPAWMIGRHKGDEEPVAADNIEWLHQGGLRNAVKVTGRYKRSKISYVVSLDKGAEHLKFAAEVDWLEAGSGETGMPQLRFKVNQSSEADTYFYDIPLGWVSRSAMDMDVPALTYACASPKTGSALAIISRDKYGYRCFDSTMSLTLIHSSYAPDPFPELGRHAFTFYLAVPAQAAPSYMGALSIRLCHPVFVQSVTVHGGTLPTEYSLMSCDAAISCVKPAEDNSGDIIIRLYDDMGINREAIVKLPVDIASAYLCTLTEKPSAALKVMGGMIYIPITKNGCATVRIRRQRREERDDKVIV